MTTLIEEKFNAFVSDVFGTDSETWLVDQKVAVALAFCGRFNAGFQKSVEAMVLESVDVEEQIDHFRDLLRKENDLPAAARDPNPAWN